MSMRAVSSPVPVRAHGREVRRVRVAVDAMGSNSASQETRVLPRTFRSDGRDRLRRRRPRRQIPAMEAETSPAPRGMRPISRLIVTPCGTPASWDYPPSSNRTPPDDCRWDAASSERCDAYPRPGSIPGKCSLIWMPGTLVAMGRNVPRISSGTSGLQLNISKCDGPPERNSMMTERAAAQPHHARRLRLQQRRQAKRPQPQRADFRRSGATPSQCRTPPCRLRPSMIWIPEREKDANLQPSYQRYR